MDPRARRLVTSGIDRALAALDYRGADLELARADAIDSARSRLRAVRQGTAIVRGSRIVVTARGHAELRPFERPLAGAGEVTVEVLASAVSAGTERAQWLRLPNAQLDPPYTPGYSGAGRVLAGGDGGAGFEAGSLVAVARLPHASVVTVPTEWATPVPDGVDVAEAALVYLAIISGYGVERAQIGRGDPLCVVGAGPIGALAHRLATLRHPGRVTVVASSRRREAAAREAGADEFLTAGEDLDHVQASTVIEATGDPAALSVAVAAARPGGRIVLLGSPRGATPSAILADAQSKRLCLAGAHVSALAVQARRTGGDPIQALARSFLAGLAQGGLAVADLAGEPLDPREPQLAYRRLARGEIAAAHFDWSRLAQAQRAARRSPASRPALAPARPRLRAPTQSRPARDGGRRLRFALIGCGDVGMHNARALAGAGNAELAISHDPVQALAAATAAEGGGAVAASLDEALDPERVDAVCLCVPHDLHTPLVEAAAQAGLQIVVEKPLANDLVEARRAVDAARRAGVAFSVCFPYRYERPMEAAAALARGGALGALGGAAVVFHADKPESYWVGGFSGRAHSDWRSSRARAGGGVLIMNLTHYLDFLWFVARAEPERIAAVSRSRPGAEVEDSIALTVEFRGGALGSIVGSASTRGAPGSRFELWGELGTLRLEPDPAVYTERAIGEVPAARWCALPPPSPADPRTLYFERFAAAVMEGRPVEVPATDGLAVQAFVDAAYRAIDEDGPVTVAPPEASERPELRGA
ncbi:MAG TPA: Gfo/Idh/MocA family oxidoreductase [Solirubrobacteraceae bacterium]|nr:Gfo/Idh/MocA family oxidoreductase [Solirubrobacteraceae bacterium]